MMTNAIALLLILAPPADAHAVSAAHADTVCALAAPVAAGEPDSVMFEVGASPVKLCYQQFPAAGRAQESWRAIGAAAPVLHTTIPLTIGSVSVAAGSYSLHPIPQTGEWQLLVVRIPDEALGIPAGPLRDREVGRTYVPAERARTVSNTLTARTAGGGGNAVLFLVWANIEIAIPIIRG